MPKLSRTPAAVSDTRNVLMGDMVDEAGNPYNPKDAERRPYNNKKPAKFDPPKPDDFYSGGWNYDTEGATDQVGK